MVSKKEIGNEVKQIIEKYSQALIDASEHRIYYHIAPDIHAEVNAFLREQGLPRISDLKDKRQIELFFYAHSKTEYILFRKLMKIKKD
jgi:hypothetical protein